MSNPEYEVGQRLTNGKHTYKVHFRRRRKAFDDTWLYSLVSMAGVVLGREWTKAELTANGYAPVN